MLATSLLHTLSLGSPPGWTMCGGLEHAYNRTACPSTATCARQLWVPGEGNWGCCPYPNAVSCGDYTCCPQGTTCQNKGHGAVTASSCVDNTGKVTQPGADGGGQEVCKTGGHLAFSTTKANIIILGDSVSIGYTPKVNALMNETALVQHSPWDTRDGGAEETHYGWMCLDFLMRAPDGTPLAPDLLYFNFGLHNLGDHNSPGQYGPLAEYAPYLDKITAKLAFWTKKHGTKLLFGLTTPWMCDPKLDANVTRNNAAAVTIMQKYGVPYIDLHATIIKACGPSPNTNCLGQSTCFCPHCSGVGYEYLAEQVLVPAFNKMLPTRSLPDEPVVVELEA